MTAEHAVQQILKPHLEQGLELWLEGDALRFKAPKEMMTQDLVAVLKSNKPDILAWLKAESQHNDNQLEPELLDEYPLAYTQGAIWMLYKFAPNSPAYNTTFACTLAPGIDETAVRQAFHALMVRHPVLRSTFLDTSQGPRQRVWSHIPMPLQFVDGSQWNEEELQQQLEQEADAPFDLHDESCLRVKLFQNTVQGDILIATIQHVGADLWALLIVAQDIKAFYEKAARGEALSVQPVAASYRQHVEWQQSFMDSARGRKERFYWQQQLNGAPLAISLPEDMPRPPLLKLEASTTTHRTTNERYQAIKQFCKQHSITPFVFIQSAFQLLVHQRTSAQDFLVGTPTMGRSRKGMDQVVGDFANPVVLRASVHPYQSLQELFVQVKRTLLAAMEHQECPFPIVVQDCNPPRDSSRTPLFQLMFVWHQGNADMMPKDGFIKEVLPISGPRGAPYDVMLAVSDLGDHFELNWTYQTSLYQRETVDQFAHDVSMFMDALLSVAVDSSVHELLQQLNMQNQSELRAQEQVLRQQVLQWVPALEQVDYQVLVDQAAEDKLFRRIMLACSPEQGRVLHSQLQEHFQDIAFLPSLPYTPEGNVDAWALRQQTAVDQHQLRSLLQAAGGAPSDLFTGRRREILPTYSQDELHPQSEQTKQSSVTATASIAKVVLEARPLAWMKGESFTDSSLQASHLFEALQHTAQSAPDKGFLFVSATGEESLYTYAQLEQDAYVTAAGLCEAGLQAQDIVLLQMHFDQRFFAVWWGAILAGIRPLVVAAPEHYHERNGVAQKLYNVAHNFDELVVAADYDRVEDTQHWLGDSKRVINADTLLKCNQPYQPMADNPDPVAFLQLTSGSTGTPKAIQITHQGILHHVASSAQFNGYTSDDVSLNWLPFDHVVPILTTHLKDVVLGIQQVQLPTQDVLTDPLLWLKAMSRYRVTFSWAPNFAYQRVLDALQSCDGALDLDLSCISILMNAGEQVLAPVVKSFSAALAPYGLRSDAVQPAFGMAEACTCMTYNNNASTQLAVYFRPTEDRSVVDVVSGHSHGQGFVDLGPVIPGVEVRITDEQNQVVKEGVIGRMQIRGPVITPGYLNNPDANAEAFVGDGWFNSGDLGFIWNQRLILTGREKEMIVVNGANFYCFELEQVATKVSGVLPTFVAATGVSMEQGANSDVLVLFYVAAETGVDQTALERDVTARVIESFSVTPRYVLAVSEAEFFKTTSGKIQRGQFKKLFEGGHYREACRDFDERHGGFDKAIDTVFGWRAKVRSLVGNASSNHAENHQILSLDDAKTAFLKDDTQQQYQKCMLDLGWTELHTDSPESTLYELCQQLAGLAPALTGSVQHMDVDVSLWLRGKREDLALVKPLIETLRQETGMERLSCVITPKTCKRPYFPSDTAIVWQDGNAEESLELVSVSQNPVPNDVVVRRGTYLITGGLGGLAEPIIDHLINTRNATVLLAGRQPLAEDVRRQSRFNQLRSRYGEQVQYICLPSWDVQTISTVIQTALEENGRSGLDGVFHLAGHMAMAPLNELTPEHWASVMNAKCEGSRALAEYLQSAWPRSMLVQFGSVNAFFGGRSAAAYSAANAVQTQVTNQLNRSTNVRSWCLNWSVWQGTGMARQFSASDLQMARNKGFLPLSVERDAVLIPRLLQMKPDNYFVGLDRDNEEIQKQVNPWIRSREIIDLVVDGSHLEGIDRLRAELQSVAPALMAHAHTPQWNLQVSSDPLPRDDSGLIRADQARLLLVQGEEPVAAPESALERDLASIWSDVLGRPVLDVSRSFFEYGGHSINATQVVAAINNKLGLPVTVANLFQYPTIRELAQLMADGTPDNTLSLALGDCLAREDGYRLDVINPDSEANKHLVFLPTALGLPAAYGQMAAALSGYKLLAATLPVTDQQSATITEMAAQLVERLEQGGLLQQDTVLIGWSMAGVLGYEMIAQLSSQNKPLPRLIMLDSGFADGLHEITFESGFQRLMFAVELGLTMEHYADFNQQPDDNTKLHWLKQYLQTIGVEVSEEMLLEWWKAYYKRLKSLLAYQLEGELVDADINMLKAALHTHGRKDLGWNDNKNRIKWTSIQADHQGIVKQSETFRKILELVS